MIGAALKSFAIDGYQHASTDAMVRDAGISKGLLFHYFETKLGLYSFVYDYAVRVVGINISTNVSRQERNFFQLAEQMERAWADAMQQFPYIRLFLASASCENYPEAAAAILEARSHYEESQQEIADRADLSIFKPGVDADRIRLMIRYTAEGLLRQHLHDGTFVPSDFYREMKDYLKMLQLLASK